MLVLTSTFPRWVGDTEPRFVLDLCRHLSDDAEIQVLAPHCPGAALEETIEGVRVQRFRYFVPGLQAVAYQGGISARLRENPWRVLQLPVFFTALWWASRRLIHSWNPHVIHAHWIIPQGWMACLAAWNRVPVLCTSHGGDLYGLRGPLFQRLKAWTLRRCRTVTVVSQSMVQPVTALAPQCHVEVISMGADLTTQFTALEDPSTRNDDHILFVGRLVEKKGLRHLLQAVPLIQGAHPALKLTIAGDGPLKEELQRQTYALGIEKSVKFLGSVRHCDLPALYRRATVAVFPFVVAEDGDQEGFGLVVVEAMGCGCPVIASDLPAVRQSIQHGVTGLLTPPGDPRALADTIHRCLADAPMRTKLAMSALKSARERFDWPSIATRYRQIIENCIER